MKRIMLSIPPMKDKSTENILREIVRQLNFCLDEIDSEMKKIKERSGENEV